MDNGTNALERLWKVQASVNHLILKGSRDARKVAEHLQAIIEDAKRFGVAPFRILSTFDLVVPLDFTPEANLTWCGIQYPLPTDLVQPGQTLEVGICEQMTDDTTTSDERIGFVKENGGKLLGAVVGLFAVAAHGRPSAGGC